MPHALIEGEESMMQRDIEYLPMINIVERKSGDINRDMTTGAAAMHQSLSTESVKITTSTIEPRHTTHTNNPTLSTISMLPSLHPTTSISESRIEDS
jgi:hypothetical protein